MILDRLLCIAVSLTVFLASMSGLSGYSEKASAESNKNADSDKDFDDDHFFLDLSSEWPAFRHDIRRSAHQPLPSALSDPARVSRLHIGWAFSPSDAKGFRASPIVFEGRVYIGNGNGRFYALDARTGALLWQFPPSSDPPLTSAFTCNPSSFGIASSAAIAHIKPRHGHGVDAVIFGAPDPQAPIPGLDPSNVLPGSGRLFALNAATGAVIWKSPVIASLTGLTEFSPSELHEQIGYSAPLVFSGRVYVGIANHCDNPIQRGKVVAVHLNTGAIDSAFSFFGSGPPRGGGVWSSVAGFRTGIYVTTGNTNIGLPAEPPDNHGLSLLRLDADTGSIVWKHQPVPFELDFDPDWAAGATVMLSSCGTLVASTQKDGWTYAIDAGNGIPAPPSVRWQFPATGLPFTPSDGTVHGDSRYLRPGAAWENVYITMTGGLNVVTDVASGYKRLHGLNACASAPERIRWLLDVPGASGATYSLGPPTVSHGIVFVGTDTGRLIVFADPSRRPPAGMHCEYPDILPGNCLANGFRLVPEPAVLADVQLAGPIFTEPALARGRVFVGTGRGGGDRGTLYMLEP